MTKTTFIVPEIPGAKRTSERVYTHAVVGQHDNLRARACAESRKIHFATDSANFAYYTKALNAGGNSYCSVEEATKALNGAADVEDYFTAQCARRLAYVIERYGQADIGQPAVLQWSMSAGNADKAHGAWVKRGYRGLRTVPCQPKDAPPPPVIAPVKPVAEVKSEVLTMFQEDLFTAQTELAFYQLRPVAYVIVCETLPLAFDTGGGIVRNARHAKAWNATQFNMRDASRVAANVKNGNGAVGEVHTVVEAIEAEIKSLEHLIAALETK